jgi:serine/threonine-protein kinase
VRRVTLAAMLALAAQVVGTLAGLDAVRWFGVPALLLLVWLYLRRPPRAPRASEPQLSRYGQYTLVREIGAGGMGVVYEVRHSLLRRPTALKVIRNLDTDPAARAEALMRFEREVQLTSQLSHPNTIVIYDYGRTDDGTFYYAMEYVDGVDLERLVRVGGPLPPARVIHLALQVCGSLAEAHAQALIHRDIKPANLLVCERGGVPDTVKVLDFGLVKPLDGQVVSGVNVLVGTPLYMAPEVRRDPSRASVRSDIYSLGAVMQWLATATTLPELAPRHSSPALHPNWRHLPLDLERLIVRCTEQDPCERPENMEELASELRHCADYGRWTSQDARDYWESHGKRLSRQLAQPAAPGARTLSAS